MRDLCQEHSPRCGECSWPNLLSENVKRSRDQVHASLRDVRRRVLETPRASQELGVESFRSAIGMPFVSDVQETHTVSMAASMSTAVQSGAAPPRAPRTSAEGHDRSTKNCLSWEEFGAMRSRQRQLIELAGVASLAGLNNGWSLKVGGFVLSRLDEASQTDVDGILIGSAIWWARSSAHSAVA